MNRTAVLSVLAAAFAGSAAVAQPVAGQISCVGFRARSQTGYAVRAGQWTPVLCELTSQLNQHFQGELVCEQVDLDGDRVTFRQPIVLTAGEGLKRVWLYAVMPVAYAASGRPLSVNVLSEDGIVVNTLHSPNFDVLHDEMLVLDISERPVAKLAGLQTGSAFAGDAFGPREHYRHIAVSAMQAHELPDRWWGMEAVDVIVWDKPDPDLLTAAQTQALIDWVSSGGQLVLGIGPAWSKLGKSELARLLPFDPAAASSEAVKTLPRFAAQFKPGAERVEFKAPIEVMTATLGRGIQTAWENRAGGAAYHLIMMDTFGSGRVTVVAASLADLMDVLDSEESRAFCRAFLDINLMHKEWIDAEAHSMFVAKPPALLSQLTYPVEFSGTGDIFKVAALVFVGLYVLLSTLVTRYWLNKRNLATLNWTAFAISAVAASALGLLGVRAVRGFSRLHSVSFVDMQADSGEASGPVWFGFKSAGRARLDFSLPGEGNYLRALTPDVPDPVQYATPHRYVSHPVRASLTNTLVRASLKQFEGHWRGKVDGALRAQIVMDRESGRITPESWIKNDLGVPLRDAWLLYLNPRSESTQRAASAVTRSARVLPAGSVFVASLPAIPAGEKVARIAQDEYQRLDQRILRWQQNPGSEPQPDLPKLRDLHIELGRRLGGGAGAMFVSHEEKTDAAALLASTRNLYLGMNERLDAIQNPITAFGLVDYDVSHWLLSQAAGAATGQAVLIAVADEPGPATLHAGEEPVEAEPGRSKAYFRVRIPFTITGHAPTAPQADPAAPEARPPADVGEEGE